MKKIIKLTESDIKKMVKSSINRLIKETIYNGSFNENNSLVDMAAFSATADRYEKYAQEIRMFIEEYERLFKTLITSVQRLGLVLTYKDVQDSSQDNDWLERGFSCKYIFSDGTDADARDDEAAYEKMVMAAREIENAINPDDLETCRVEVTGDEDGVEVYIEFGVWE